MGRNVNDVIIDSISNSRLKRENISFGELRRIAGRDYDIWETLGNGRAILSTCEQLDQYLFSYGLMTKAQWDILLPTVSLPSGDLHLIDYGCGQGLGCAILFDHFGASLTRRIKQVKLIEPSDVALQRAKAVVDCYLGGQRSETINKVLDDVTRREIQMNGGTSTVHLLSNVLDLSAFNHGRLFNEILAVPGKHTVLAVSHDRNFNGGSSRFVQLDKAIKDPKYTKQFAVESSVIQQYTCGTNKPAISWELRVEVISGFV